MSGAGPISAQIGAMVPLSSETLAQMAQSGFRPPAAMPAAGLMQPPGLVSSKPLGEAIGKLLQQISRPRDGGVIVNLSDDFLSAMPAGLSPEIRDLLYGVL